MTTQSEHFQQQVYYWVKQIPYGKVAYYGQIARLAGFPRHARHVSKALGKADKSLKLPWYRVIGRGTGSNGKIAFDTDSDSYAKQQHLLEQEGIKIIQGKINLQQFGWSPVEQTVDTGDLTPEEFFK